MLSGSQQLMFPVFIELFTFSKETERLIHLFTTIDNKHYLTAEATLMLLQRL